MASIKRTLSDSDSDEEYSHTVHKPLGKKEKGELMHNERMTSQGTGMKRSASDSDSSAEDSHTVHKSSRKIVKGELRHDESMTSKGTSMKRSAPADKGTVHPPPAKKDKKEGDGQGMYNQFAAKMMAKMGYKEGSGLGKNAQGRVGIVEASMQRGRRGLGLTVKGLEPSMDIEWNEDDDQIIIDEKVDWLPKYTGSIPDVETLRSWKVVGEKKRTLDNECEFCDPAILNGILTCKSIFDNLEAEEMRKARTRSNPYETIRGVFFLNRAAVKMANMDAVLDFMFTSPKYSDGKPMVKQNGLLYFADICAGPGGFSEYVLWRAKGEAKGFGLTLRGSNDFKLENFFAGPPEMFEPHYGCKGDGDIFSPENQAAFIQFVLDNARDDGDDSEDNTGVHMAMADGGFSVEGQENIQEILSKQLYLCQFLVAISILRKGGHFVCKLFDLFTPFSVGLVYLMNTIFEHTSIFKPVTSRPANSERYIVCKGLLSKKDVEPVRQYFHEINLDLNKYLSTTSKIDVNHVVSLVKMIEDTDFYEYICQSNNSLGTIQILNLKKIRAFAQNTNLYETRQNETRAKLLEKWAIPDKVRTAPPRSRPQDRANDLIGSERDILDHETERLTAKNISNIHGIYDYKCVVTGDVPENRVYILGLGRSWVFQRQCVEGAFWLKLRDLKLELPRNTLLEAEFVTEYRGEGSGQRKMTTLHVLDALFLYDVDVRDLSFDERIERLRSFTKSITKLTRPDLIRVKVPEVFSLEDMNQIYSQLHMRKVKGGGNVEQLCYYPRYNPENQYYRPTGVYFIRTVQAPWTKQWSRSNQRWYYFNTRNGQSVFECPPETKASVRYTKLHSYLWAWEEGVKLLEEQACAEDHAKLSKADVKEHLRRIMAHR